MKTNTKIIRCRGRTRTCDRAPLLESHSPPTELHDTIYILNNHSSQTAGSHASTKPSRTIGLALINRLLVLFNTPLLPWLIRLSLSPTFPSALHYYLSSHLLTYLVGRSGFGTYLVAFGCTYGLGTVSSTPSACRSLSLPFRFDTRTGLRPGCCTSSVISTNDVAYLPGLSLYVPRRSWKVVDSNHRRTSCFQHSLTLLVPFLSANPPNLSYPDFSLSLS